MRRLNTASDAGANAGIGRYTNKTTEAPLVKNCPKLAKPEWRLFMIPIFYEVSMHKHKHYYKRPELSTLKAFGAKQVSDLEHRPTPQPPGILHTFL